MCFIKIRNTKTMKKITIALAAAALFSNTALAQVKYKLTRLADNQTYQVGMIPDVTWSYPMNVTLTAQVGIKVPASAHFIAGRITNLVQNTRWLDNTYIEKPDGDKNNTYVLFNLQTQGTKALTFNNSEEVPLFTFQNIGTSCFGTIELVDNNNNATKSVVANGFNVGQSFTTMGANGEAYTGNAGTTTVGCPNSTSAQDLENTPLSIARVFPAPASTELTVEFKLEDDKLEKLNLEVSNATGQVVFTEKLTVSKSLQTQKLTVKSWAEGMYYLRLVSEKGVSKTKTFVVVH
jgi:Secretion system C-terminal sorting domain